MNHPALQEDAPALEQGATVLRARRPTIAIAALLVALLACGLAAWSLLATHRSTNANRDAVASLQSTISALEQSATQRESTLATTMRDFEQRLADTEQRLHARATAWLVAEAEYFLSLAQEQLNLNHDTGTAIAALAVADARLQRATLSKMHNVRAEIAKAIATLNAAPRPDLASHALKLAVLIARANQLPLARAAEAAPIGAAPPEATPATVLATLWSRFTSLIVVRRSSQALPTLLTPEQTLLLHLNLRLQLESARVAMLHRDPDNYVASLNAARDWLAKYFDQTEHEVTTARTQLDELAHVDIAWHAPDISAPLLALRTMRVKTGARDPSPPAAPAGVTP